MWFYYRCSVDDRYRGHSKLLHGTALALYSRTHVITAKHNTEDLARALSARFT